MIYFSWRRKQGRSVCGGFFHWVHGRAVCLCGCVSSVCVVVPGDGYLTPCATFSPRFSFLFLVSGFHVAEKEETETDAARSRAQRETQDRDSSAHGHADLHNALDHTKARTDGPNPKQAKPQDRTEPSSGVTCTASGDDYVCIYLIASYCGS